MKSHVITFAQLQRYKHYLCAEERAESTVNQYTRALESFILWLAGKSVTKERASAWKDHLLKSGLKSTTVNIRISALNGFFLFMGWNECKVRHLRIQRRLFREENRELTKKDYECLLKAAKETGKNQLALLMETICATGIRVSEVQYITVHAAKRRQTEIRLKGKVRTIILPGKLCHKLLKFAKKQKIVSGEIFLTRNGKGMSRRQIWAEMKSICKAANVDASKVFPHNLRHLFARTFYHATHDVAKLADVLGHSSIETTRIYLISTGAEHARQMDRLGLIT